MPQRISSVITYGTARSRWNGTPRPLACSAYCPAAAMPKTAVPRGAPLDFQRREVQVEGGGAFEFPASEEDDGEGDESAAGHHVFGESARQREREVGAREAGEDAFD